MRTILLGVVLSMTSLMAIAKDDIKPDPWKSVRFMVGAWKGVAEGESGRGAVSRTYAFVLNDRFIEERNNSVYPPQEANKKGETHEHRSFLSYDRKRKTLMLRQFHQEGFVNLYALDGGASTDMRLVFNSENFENFDNSWKARETYEVISPDEFIETFELAEPGKEYLVYSKNHFTRDK